MISNNFGLVSVAMATYNGSRYIASQLESIINQTYQDIEIIIVDDCSSDDTVSIIHRYANQYEFIKLYENTSNLGIVKTFSKAMELCTGKYIALSDQDDVWFPDKLERLVANISDNLLIHCDTIVVDDKMSEIAKSGMENTHKDYNKSTFVDYLISANVTGCTVLFKRELLDLALPIPEGFYMHDHYLSIIASYYGQVKFLNEPLVYYRQHGYNSIGAARPDFDKFVKLCKVKAGSYNSLLTLPVFKNNFYIKLLRDYRMSMYLGKWTSEYSIFKILQIKHGIKLFIYYLIINGLFTRNFAKRIYNLIYKL